MKVKKWGVYKAGLDPVVGSEQGKTRPVLVISENAINDLLNVVNVIPITSRKEGRRIYPNEASVPVGSCGLPNESIALCYQIRTLDKLRLTHLYGEITDTTIHQEVREALCFQLGIEA